MAKIELREGIDIPENVTVKSAEIVIRYQKPNDFDDYYKILDNWMIVIKPKAVVADELREINKNE